MQNRPNYTCFKSDLDYSSAFWWKVNTLSAHVSVELSTAVVLKWILAVSWSCSSLRPCVELRSDSSAKCCVWYGVWPFKVNCQSRPSTNTFVYHLPHYENVTFASNILILFLYIYFCICLSVCIISFYSIILLFFFSFLSWLCNAQRNQWWKPRIGLTGVMTSYVICCPLSYLYYY